MTGPHIALAIPMEIHPEGSRAPLGKQSGVKGCENCGSSLLHVTHLRLEVKERY